MNFNVLTTDILPTLLANVNAIVWGPITLCLLVGTGLYLTLRLKLIQVFVCHLR